MLGAAAAGLAVLTVLRVDVPPSTRRPHNLPRHGGLQPTLVIVAAIVALEFALSFWLASYLDDSIGITRNAAVALVSVLYAANLAGRLLASRLARAHSVELVLAAALGLVACGLPFLLFAAGASVAVTGIVLAGAGIGALFPLTSALHVEASRANADGAVGEILSVAALGQMGRPLIVGAIAQAGTLRIGLLALLPVLTIVAAAGLAAYWRRASPDGWG